MEEIIENVLDNQGMRRVKVIGDRPPRQEFYWNLVPQEAQNLMSVNTEWDQVLNLHYLEIIWPAREAFDIHLPQWPKFRRMVIWTIIEGERMSDVIGKAADKFEHLFGRRPGYCFAGSLPKGAESEMQVHGCMLFKAMWMPARMIAVGGPSDYQGKEQQ